MDTSREFEVLTFRALTIACLLLGPCKACCQTYLHNIITEPAPCGRLTLELSGEFSCSVFAIIENKFTEFFISTSTRSLRSVLLHTGQRQE